MADNHVCPPSQRLTDTDARHLLADGLIRACHVSGPAKVALAAGCDEKTIRRSRDEESTLRLDYVLNVLDADPHALDALLAACLERRSQINAAKLRRSGKAA